jgi:hypothetical protein
MNWTRVKSDKQLVLSGISVATERSDTSLKSVTFTDGVGNTVRVYIDSYNLYAEIPSPPKTVEKYAVIGTVQGLSVNENFDNQYEADNRLEELTGRLDEEKFDLKIEKVQVPEED